MSGMLTLGFSNRLQPTKVNVPASMSDQFDRPQALPPGFLHDSSEADFELLSQARFHFWLEEHVDLTCRATWAAAGRGSTTPSSIRVHNDDPLAIISPLWVKQPRPVAVCGHTSIRVRWRRTRIRFVNAIRM